VRKDQGIWNSVTTVPNLTDPILPPDRLLLAVIVGCRNIWINWYQLFNISTCSYIHGRHAVARLVESLHSGFNSRWS